MRKPLIFHKRMFYKKIVRRLGKRSSKNIAIRVGMVTGVLFAIASVFYVLLPDFREEIIFVLSALAGWGAVYSAYFVGETLKVQIEQKNMDLAQDRVNRSFAIKAEFDAPQLIEFRTKIEAMVQKIREEYAGADSGVCAQKLYEGIADDPEMLTAARSILNKIESASLAIQFGNADERVLYRDLSMIVVNTYRNLESFVMSRRNREEVHNAHRAFRETEKLVTAWEKRRLLSTGEYIAE